MDSKDLTRDNIQLSLPIDSAYVSAARLTASSIADRMFFDIDEVEDIKAAVSEACAYIIKQSPQNAKNEFTITFDVGKDALNISVDADVFSDPAPRADEMAIGMIKALMDDFDLCSMGGGRLRMTMAKRHKDGFFM